MRLKKSFFYRNFDGTMTTTQVARFLTDLKESGEMWKQRCKKLHYRWQEHKDGGYLFSQQKHFDDYAPNSVDGLIADPLTSEVFCWPNEKVEICCQATMENNPKVLSYTYATDGTMLRLYFHNKGNRWYYATNSKCDASYSHWRGCFYSFGDLANSSLHVDKIPDTFDKSCQYHVVITHKDLNTVIPSSFHNAALNLHYITDKNTGQKKEIPLSSPYFHCTSPIQTTLSLSDLKGQLEVAQKLSYDGSRGIVATIENSNVKYLIETPFYTKARVFWRNAGVKDYSSISQLLDRNYLKSLYAEDVNYYFRNIDETWRKVAIKYHHFYMQIYVFKKTDNPNDMRHTSDQMRKMNIDVNVIFSIHQVFLCNSLRIAGKRMGMNVQRIEQFLRHNYALAALCAV